MEAINKPEQTSIPQVSWCGLDFLTVPEVAALRRCSKSTVYHDVEANRMNAYRLRGRLVFDRLEVIEWIGAHATMGQTQSGKEGLN